MEIFIHLKIEIFNVTYYIELLKFLKTLRFNSINIFQLG